MLAMKSVKKKRGRSLSTDHSSSSKNYKVDYNIPINNKFNALGQQSDAAAKTKIKTVIKPSPITITGATDVCTAINNLNVQYNIKRISIGTKIFVDKEEDFNTLCSKLKELKIEFFTHPYGNKKLFKLVLCGLPEVQTNAIADWLKTNNNVTALKIDMLNSVGSNKKYIVQFDPIENSKNDVKNINVILNHVIKWIPYKRRNRGPTQCVNCGMFGHGVSACNRKSNCLLCGESHATKECHFNDNNNEQRVFKCNNCKSNELPFNHRANDPNCPSRLRYIEIKAKSNKRNTQKSTQQFQVTENEFPRMNAHMHSRTNSEPSTVTVTPHSSRSYAYVAKSPPTQRASNQNSNANEELFTFAEISNIMLNCVNELTQCKTKLDQIKVIANLLSNVCK